MTLDVRCEARSYANFVWLSAGQFGMRHGSACQRDQHGKETNAANHQRIGLPATRSPPGIQYHEIHSIDDFFGQLGADIFSRSAMITTPPSTRQVALRECDNMLRFPACRWSIS
ncbi:MAG: hypothetical protein AAGF31_01765 [Planctomycetota bacterium]